MGRLNPGVWYLLAFFIIGIVALFIVGAKEMLDKGECPHFWRFRRRTPNINGHWYCPSCVRSKVYRKTPTWRMK